MRSVSVLGSTGSIGTPTLDVLARHRDRWTVAALAAKTDVDGLVAQNRAFHARLYALSGSRVLPPIIDSLWLQVGPYIRPSVEHIDVAGGRSLHHVEVIDALRRRQPIEARAAIERDIDRFFDIAFDVVKTMEKRNVELKSVMP